MKSIRLRTLFRSIPFQAVLTLTLGWVGLCQIALITRTMTGQTVPALEATLNCFVILVCFSIFFFASPLFQFYRSMPHVHRWIATSLVGATLFFHVLNMERISFPFVRWNMFTWNWTPDEVIYHTVYGERKDETFVKITPVALFPSIHNCFPLVFNQSSEIVYENPEKGHIYNEMLVTIGKAYNEQNPETSITALVVERSVLVFDLDNRKTIQRQVFRRVELSKEEQK